MPDDRPSDRELLRWVVNAWDRLPARPTPLIRIVEDIRARLAEPEEPTLRSLVGAVPDLTGGIESVTYLQMKREIAELRADLEALVPFAVLGVIVTEDGLAAPTEGMPDVLPAARAVLARWEKEGTDA